MARLRFRKPKIAILMSEVISLTIWIFLGDRIVTVLDSIVGNTFNVNISGTVTSLEGCTNESVFGDAFEILGVGYDCEDITGTQTLISMHNSENGLLGVVGLVMVVMVLMNFVTYN